MARQPGAGSAGQLAPVVALGAPHLLALPEGRLGGKQPAAGVGLHAQLVEVLLRGREGGERGLRYPQGAG